MRLELQFSFCFLTDYLAAKVIALIADRLPVGTTTSIASLVAYAPQASPTIVNRGSGVVGVAVELNPSLPGLLPALKLDLSASTSSQGLTVTATLVNRDEIVAKLSSLNASIDPNLIPSSVAVPVDLTSIAGQGQPAPTKAGFAARTDARIVALRVELDAATAADSASWTAFLDSHSFTPAFQPDDITVEPPREWAALVDWQIVKPLVAMQLEPLVTSRASAKGVAVTGSFVYAWGLSRGDQPSGFSDGWPFDSNGAFDFDVTCPIHTQGHDGHFYFQIGLWAKARNRMHVHVENKAHVSCVWQDQDPVEQDDAFGPFGFDGNSLYVDAISTDVRGMVLRGEAVLLMPLAFPAPSVSVGNFAWMFEDACNARTLAQIMVVYLTNATGGRTTPLRGHLTVDAPFPCRVELIPSVDAQGKSILDAQGIGIAPLTWTVTVAAQDVPAGGGHATLSVETNAGSLPSGSNVSVLLAPPLTDTEKLQMEAKAVATCESARHLGYVKKFIPDPPEEIWSITQELLLVPAATRAGAPMAAAGVVTRIAVPKSRLAAAIRQQKENPHGVVQQHSIGPDGVRVVVHRVELPASTRTEVTR